jgi:hypothetical protein
VQSYTSGGAAVAAAATSPESRATVRPEPGAAGGATARLEPLAAAVMLDWQDDLGIVCRAYLLPLALSALSLRYQLPCWTVSWL